jgi:catechol 2,3-dioxygenase-like lactoylglutathione lyase family enzyme
VKRSADDYDADFDHTSFAVHDARSWAHRLRQELGAVPIAGEAIEEFRYLLLYAGTADDGSRIELLEPTGAGFLTRFLRDRGEGPHHITFSVTDLQAAVRAVRELGLTVVGENYAHAAWQEAFIAPDGLHATVIQLAHSDRDYPTPRELLNVTERRPAAMPSVIGARDPNWWTGLWETEPQQQRALGATRLGSSNLDASRQLFEGVLCGDVQEVEGGLLFVWPSGRVHVQHSERPGVIGMNVLDEAATDIVLGSSRISARL